MGRNNELIEKYKRYIKSMESEANKTESTQRRFILEAKISVYKMVIIDLQN